MPPGTGWMLNHLYLVGKEKANHEISVLGALTVTNTVEYNEVHEEDKGKTELNIKKTEKNA